MKNRVVTNKCDTSNTLQADPPTYWCWNHYGCLHCGKFTGH